VSAAPAARPSGRRPPPPDGARRRLIGRLVVLIGLHLAMTLPAATAMMILR
jgi:hypothetical protein